MTCTHKDPDYWETETWEDDWGNTHTDTKRVYGRSLQKDIDLHRFRCTRCGEIGYYSGAARAYHEDGVKSDITGLGG